MEHGHAAVAAGDWLSALERSPVGEAMRSSLWLYPAVETLHIIGFALLVGAIAAYDLRLMGVRLVLPADQLARLVLPVAVTGFLLAAPAGLLLFTSEATAFAANPMFLTKLALLALALANIAVFHAGVGRRIAGWADVSPPRAARLAGAVSLLVWLGVIACGRLIAYF